MNQNRNHKQLKYNGVVFNTSEKRFRPKGDASIYHQKGTQPIIGPGSYVNTENSMIKKSFNMSMEHSYFVWFDDCVQPVRYGDHSWPCERLVNQFLDYLLGDQVDTGSRFI